ncbi:hypothetical protein [Paraburkholderia silviterrae]|uniref:Uncharacterized protein n=1 Tax=Paraburkholderia silviterrae TaxID=2528715 RepID=A0A4R5M5B5_9BURK|nr:hypothetical protein [Paraburkholderia silviterrae]TDG21143.1 hypothetical protein EYW47_22495 [Paraburkholderia silviterrae]
MSLTSLQAEHVAKVYPECRAEMTGYLKGSAQVVIYRQDECGDDVPPYAIRVEGTDFWIDCCATPEDARKRAEMLGLMVLKVQG